MVVDDIYDMTVLVPFVDLFNQGTDRENNVSIRYEEQKDYTKTGFYVRAVKDIDAGEELLGNYGVKTNQENMLRYGFFDPAAP